MRLKAKFKAITVDVPTFKKKLHERLVKELTEGCKIWLGTVVKESTAAGLPIWSGSSLATFGPLASRVNFSLGRSRALKALSVEVLGGVGLFEPGTRSPNLYTFTYQTALNHLIINEYNNANSFINPNTGTPYFKLKNPGPYNFQIKAEQAFRQFAATVTIPGWEAILKVQTIVVG